MANLPPVPDAQLRPIRSHKGLLGERLRDIIDVPLPLLRLRMPLLTRAETTSLSGVPLSVGNMVSRII